MIMKKITFNFMQILRKFEHISHELVDAHSSSEGKGHQLMKIKDEGYKMDE